MTGEQWKKYAVPLVGLILIGIHNHIYLQFFPNNQGNLGHDYMGPLPFLLDGYFWYMKNGIFDVPWFTPSFCGGVPKFPNPQAGYYSIPQVLSFLFNPLVSVKITFLLFSAIGFSGFYILLRRLFVFARTTALLGAAIFLFNGFYSYRMVVGHFNFHPFMVLPIVALWLIRPVHEDGRLDKKRFAGDTILAGLAISYMIYSGAASILPPFMLAILGIGALFAMTNGESFRLKIFILKLLTAVAVASALSASKLVAVISYLRHFPRDYYQLPGYETFSDIAAVLMNSLFWAPSTEFANKAMVNAVYAYDRSTFEYGITFVPLIIIVVGLAGVIYGLIVRRPYKIPTLSKSLWAGALILVLLIPVALNYYTPPWNAFLKSVPLVKTSSILIRWFLIYIPIVTVISCIALERGRLLKRYGMEAAAIGIIAVVVFNISTDRDHYHTENYDPKPIIIAHNLVKAGKWTPEISRVKFAPRGNKAVAVPFKDRNNFIAYGISQLNCYDPIFGYGLEKFPQKELRQGPVMQEISGKLNIKNPACYVYPEENNCSPGDHFTVGQKEYAKSFANYKGYPFKMSFLQKLANAVSIAAFLGSMLFIIFRVAGRVKVIYGTSIR